MWSPALPLSVILARRIIFVTYSTWLASFITCARQAVRQLVASEAAENWMIEASLFVTYGMSRTKRVCVLSNNMASVRSICTFTDLNIYGIRIIPVLYRSHLVSDYESEGDNSYLGT